MTAHPHDVRNVGVRGHPELGPIDYFALPPSSISSRGQNLSLQFAGASAQLMVNETELESLDPGLFTTSVAAPD